MFCGIWYYFKASGLGANNFMKTIAFIIKKIISIQRSLKSLVVFAQKVSSWVIRAWRKVFEWLEQVICWMQFYPDYLSWISLP